MVDIATLQRMHPTWNLVDAIEGPRGQGIVALGSDGGVFALDSTGGTTGLVAPLAHTPSGAFSYTTLAPTDRQAGAAFAKGGITLLPNGGYRLTNVNQQNYDFSPPPAPALTQAGPSSTAGTQQATDATPGAAAPNLSGTAALHAVLDPLGLGGLVPDALAALNQPGATPDWVTQVWLPQQKPYQDAFPEIAAAQAQATAAGPGAAPHIPTPAEIVTYRQTAQQMVDQGLLPPEFVTKDKISALINGGVSISEFQNRVLTGVDQFMNADAADQAAFLAYHPAVDFSHAVGALLDPTLNEAAVNRAVQQAKIGGSAIRSGLGPISADWATRLQQAGQGSASQFEQAALQNPLTQANIGEAGDVTRDTQLGAITGDAADQAAINRRLATRQGQFQGGGGSASGGSGRQGLGSSG